MMIKVFLLLLLWSVDKVNPVYAGADTKDNLSGSGNDEDDCNSGNYTFYSFTEVPNSIYCNIIINVSTDISLSSNIHFKDINNIIIIGQGDSTVNCNSIGSVKFVSCNNVSVEGLTGKGVVSVNNPGMRFHNTSNIAIQSCSFHHSTSRAVTLSKVSGTVSINNCLFKHNKYHKRHGAAIYYTSSHELSTQW